MSEGTNHKNALILGLGMSGEAAARLLTKQGCAVTVVDAADAASCAKRSVPLEALGVRVLSDVTTLPEGNFDLCVVSPGIDQASAWVREIEARDVEVVSELELGYRHCKCPLVAVTGTNGKSTLVKLLSEVLEAGGLRSMMAGNCGVPLCDEVEASELLDWIVVEVSSFQLERVSTFHPKVGIILNLQPDHLDRHGDMATYRALKARLFARMGAEDTAIVHEDEVAEVQALVNGVHSWVTFGCSETSDTYYDASGYVMGQDEANGGRVMDLRGTGFNNPILGQAAAAAVAVADACGVTCEAAARALRAFVPLSHRMEFVREVNGVSFINDSKATNLASLEAGVKMAKKPIRLVAGGQLKEKELEFVKEVLATNVACVYLIGQSADTLKAAWSDAVTCVCSGDLKTAVAQASADAEPGDTVLLSPGCASFDQFTSYRDRGETFRNTVEAINEERKHENVISG
jgi:UDP-N-acetylmuramoylalanine--D-glutamate ligase